MMKIDALCAKTKLTSGNIKAFLFPVLLSAFPSCENMIQYIDIENDNRPPLLAVSAVIDTYDGTFNICFTEARSLSSYSDWRPDNETIVRRGSITLYEDDRLLFRKESEGSGFDMSLNDDRSGYSFEKRQLPFRAGSSYRLELDIEGYPPASAVAVMPDAPLIESAEIDMQQTIKSNRLYTVERLGNAGTGYHSEIFHPLNVRLTDNSTERDYYLIRQHIHTTQSGSDDYSWPTVIAISNKAIIQDNPDMETVNFLGGEEADVFIFDCILLSDMSFANTTGLVDLLTIPEISGWKTPLPCENPMLTTSLLLVSHLSQETFAYYRSLVLQNNGVGFFTEPVSIVSNIENGYGCFSALNTVSKSIAEAYFCEGFYLPNGF
ncbi:MAG: DUF4249 domain-containing protein [Bacteroidales bacterium]|nr:DUF4249 domain-containing protein [Bacteroidales bacterium]